jgi:ankyrin repeat protein
MRSRWSRVAAGLAVALLVAGCDDGMRSAESREEIDAVRAAVEANPAAVNQPTSTGELPILVAARVDSPSLANWLIDRGASPVARNARGRTPLHDFVIYDRPAYSLLQQMLAHGEVNANVADPQGVTPLHVAAQFLQPRAVEILLEAGADPNRADHLGRTPLHELGGLLQPPDPKLPPPDPKSAAAQPAATLETLDRLLDAGATLESADLQSMRPLHVYALAGNAAAARAALSRDADVAAVDVRGQTPLFWAAAFARVELTTLLLEAGADARHRDANRRTVLDIMRYTVPTPADSAQVVAMLQAAGATFSPPAAEDHSAASVLPDRP